MKVPKAKQKANGKWYIQLRLKNADGDTVSYYIQEDTEARATAQALAVKAALKAEVMPEKRKKPDKTLRQAIDEYIDKRSNVLSPSTIKGYRRDQRNRFKSVMDKKISRNEDWQKLVDLELETYAKRTVRNAFGLVKSALKDIGIFVSASVGQIPRADIQWLTDEQIPIFVKAVQGDKCEIGALLALHSLRRSEVCAMEWDNVDLKSGILRVRGAVVEDEKGKLVSKKENKTVSSARTLHIVIPELKAALEKVEDKSGRLYSYHPNTLCRQINAVCRKNGLPEVGVHGLRHTFASLCKHLGLSEDETMRRGGWSNITTVHKIYTHISEADRLAADDKLAAFYSGENAT